MRRQIVLSIIVRFLIYFTHWMILAYLPVLLKTSGFTDIEIGLAISLYSLSSMVLMLPLGAFSDFFSPKRTILGGALLFGMSFLALMFFTSFWPIMGAITLSGLGVATLIVVSESLYLKLFGNEERGARIGLYQLSTYLGFGLGPLTGGFLLTNSTTALFSAALGACLLIFLVALGLKDCQPIHFSFRQYGADLKQPKVLLLTACVFMLGTHFGVEQTSFSLLLKEDLNASPQAIGLIFCFIGLWMAFMVPFVGRLHDRHKSLFLFLIIGLGISGIFQLLTAFVTTLPWLLTVRLLHTMGDTFALLELSVLVSILFPAARLGGSAGFMYAVRTTATFLAALLAGVLNRYWGYGFSFLSNGLLVVIFAIAALLFILLSKNRKKSVGW
ncbi:MAG: MFS transporter [Deltaproteobacteria bacterium]|nr:MFS transporter [Deltaproteobacteria bacterium]